MRFPTPTFTIAEPIGVSRTLEPVRQGIPLPRGWITHPSEAVLEVPGQGPVPAQNEVLARWPDGSIRWLLVTLLVDVPAGGRVALILRPARGGASPPAPEGRLEVTETASHFLVETGRARFEMPRGLFGPFSRVRVQGRDVLGVAGCGVRLEDARGVSLVPRVECSRVEKAGPLEAVFRFEGTFVRGGSRRGMPRFLARISCLAGSAAVGVSWDLHNPSPARHPGGLWDLGDPGSFFFRDLSIHVPARGAGQRVAWRVAPSRPVQRLVGGRVEVYQDSSGGPNWCSPNHVDARGAPTVSFQGYRLRVRSHNSPAGRSGPDTGSGGSPEIARRREESFGLRAQPWVQVMSDAGWVAGTVHQFWQNFPKTLAGDADGVRIGLFPRECRAGFELQGGEKKRHLVGLEFGVDAVPPGLEQLAAPLEVALNPAWVAWSEALPWFIPEQRDPERAYRTFVRGAVEGPRAFVSKRELVDEYGWRNFGDVWADHEAVHDRGAFPMVAHFNNQYDLIFGAAWHHLGTGDPRWRALMSDLARHVIDIDIYHTDGDRSAYNHGLFWHTDHYLPAGTATHRTFSVVNRVGRSASYGGGPSNEHNYTSGLLLYHYITGDPEARDAVCELAEWVIAMDDGRRTLLSLLDPGPTGWASQTGSPDYHRAGRGAGNSINALLDGFLVTGRRRYLDKAESLIRRCVHPDEDLAALDLDEPEYRWTYLVFLQVLGKYLEIKLEHGEPDHMFRYARASLLRFADWMVEHEVPYQDVLDKVLIPTESWPATDVRKAHVLDLAAAFGPASRRPAYRDKAAFFFRRSLEDLLAYPTATLTRPMTILVANGAFHGYFMAFEPVRWQEDRESERFDPPEPFVPQAARARATVAEHARVAAREVVRTVRERIAGYDRRVRLWRCRLR